MPKFMRVDGNLAVFEVIDADVAVGFLPAIRSDIAVGDVLTDDEAATLGVSRAVVTYPTLAPMAFYLAFKPAERIALKTSTDPMVQEFWATYQLAVQTGASIDMALQSNQEALGYLAIPKTAQTPLGTDGPGILTAERVAQVLQGTAQ